ncbi:MAG: polyprenyl synthetase family protein [Caldilineaceae bacterium]|nr:polyprenyl synthetase family protein [Caldilineaceae bacterium]MCB9138239.1 polyprenyl synthetase family protein [Caldilineaceae bacterium]
MVTKTAVNGHNPSPADIHVLLAPVKPGLRRVEEKMKAVDSALFAPLATAFVDLIGRGGKRLRPALALMTAELTGPLAGTPAYTRALSLAASVEMLHTATLVHDDVIDDALLRRGAPTLNADWSKGSTVIAGNYMFGRAAQFSAETGNMRVIRLFSDTLDIIVNGELHQLLARDAFHQEKERYYQRIYAKTASLFCAATEGAAVLAEMREHDIRSLRDFGYNFGMAFQIVDDILDFTGNEQTLGKPAGGDLRQGTLTLPFFYYLNEHPEPARLIAEMEEKIDLRDQGDDGYWDDTVRDVVAAVRAGRAIQDAQEEARYFLDLARRSLGEMPPSVYKTSMLGLCDFVVQRTY